MKGWFLTASVVWWITIIFVFANRKAASFEQHLLTQTGSLCFSLAIFVANFESTYICRTSPKICNELLLHWPDFLPIVSLVFGIVFCLGVVWVRIRNRVEQKVGQGMEKVLHARIVRNPRSIFSLRTIFGGGTNRLIRIFLLIIVVLGSFHLVNDAYGGRGDRDVDFAVIVIGLIGAIICLAIDVIQKSKLKVSDYSAVILWFVAIWLAFHESEINSEIHHTFNLKRSYLVFDSVNVFIITVFVAAIVLLAISLFAFKRSKRHSYSILLAIPIFCYSLLSLAYFVPIDEANVGSCGGIAKTRLSVLQGDQKQFDIIKQKVIQKQQEKDALRKKYPYSALEGCSIGPQYVLYLL